MSTAPVNLAGGVRMLGTTTEGTAGTAANPVLWSDNATQPNLRYSDGTHTGVGSMFVCAAAVASKGDIAVFNGTNWLPLSVGSNTQVLTADSTQASGIKWAAGGGGGGTQGGTTSASHVPYASGANTLSDGEMSFNSGTHTYSLAASTILDWSGSSGAFKTPTGAATYGGSSNTMTNALAVPEVDATANANTKIILGTNMTLGTNGGFVLPNGDGAANFGSVGGTRWAYVASWAYDTKQGAQLTAASTITPTVGQHHVTGGTTITTIAATNMPGNAELTLIADGGTITLSTGGNIGAAVTIAQNKAQRFVYDSAGTTWYPVQ